MLGCWSFMVSVSFLFVEILKIVVWLWGSVILNCDCVYWWMFLMKNVLCVVNRFGLKVMVVVFLFVVYLCSCSVLLFRWCVLMIIVCGRLVVLRVFFYDVINWLLLVKIMVLGVVGGMYVVICCLLLYLSVLVINWFVMGDIGICKWLMWWFFCCWLCWCLWVGCGCVLRLMVFVVWWW